VINRDKFGNQSQSKTFYRHRKKDFDMKKLLFILPLIAISACTATERGAAYGGLGGAAIGGIVSGDVGGAVVGGTIGAVAGAVIGHASERGQCRYQGRHGRTYIARCPAGY
jgi:hypothetical protein